MSVKSRIHDSKPRQAADQALYIGAFVFGLVGIVALKFFGVPRGAAALFPVVVLGLYAWLTWRSAALRIEPEAIGDNCYYLGFLFTLISLAWTLYEVSDKNLEVMPVVSGFGVALTSTIVGIFLRALFIQIRPDIVSKDREARMEIHQAAREFKTSLAQSIVHMKDFSRQVQQSLAEHHALFESANRQGMETQLEWMRQHVEATGKEVVRASQASMDQAFESVAGIGSAASVWTESLESIWDRLGAKVDKIGSGLDSASVKVEFATECVASAADEMRSSISKTSERIDAAGSKIAERTSRMAGELANIDELIHEKITAPLAAISPEFERLTESVDSMRKRFEEHLLSGDRASQNPGPWRRLPWFRP